MAFFVYIAILLVAISGILLELDWLTKPKLDTKSPLQTATAVLPSSPPASPKGEVAGDQLNPVYPKKLDVGRVIEPPWRQQAETTGSVPPNSSPAEPVSSPVARPVANANNVASPPPSNPQPQSVPTTTANAEQAKAEPNPPAPQSVPQVPPPPAQVVVASPQDVAPPQATSVAPQNAVPQNANASVAAPNKCDVHGCSAAYASFRTSDCTYQPYEGPRRICERPPAPRGEQNARRRGTDDDVQSVSHRRGKDDELGGVEAAVRRLRPSAAERDDGDDEDDMVGRGGHRVIVIDRPWRW